MSKRILVIQGHPDLSSLRLCRALEARYTAGALVGGHQLRLIDVGTLNFPLLRSREEFYSASAPCACIVAAQRDIEWSEHIVLFFPIWLGAMPALLKGFLEQVCRPDFTYSPGGGPGRGPPRLVGRSAHLLVTMGMPAWVYRLIFGAQGVRAFASNLKAFTGIDTRRTTMVGNVVEGPSASITAWLDRVEKLGRKGM